MASILRTGFLTLALSVIALAGCTKCDRYSAAGVCVSDYRTPIPMATIDEAISSAVEFWAQRYPSEAVNSAVRGLWLRFVVEEMPCNKWGCYPGGFIATRMIVIPYSDDLGLTAVRVRHEVGHGILQYATGLKWDQGVHHRAMCAAGFEWLSDC